MYDKIHYKFKKKKSLKKNKVIISITLDKLLPIMF